MNFTVTELALLVLVGLSAGHYAKTEGADSLLAALIGVLVAVVVALVATR